jgi:acyl transferase domain-containing protein
MIVQEYEAAPIAQGPSSQESEAVPDHVLAISGKSAKVVAQLRDDLIAHLSTTIKTKSLLSVSDICYTMTARRQQYNHRIAVTGNSIQELLHNLKKANPVHILDTQKVAKDQIMFVFSGQGSQVSP